MPFPMLLRLAAYGAPAAVATWRDRVQQAPGVPRLSSDPTTCIKLAAVRVDAFSGSASADLPRIVSLAVPGVDMIALWQDAHRARRWVHIRDGRVSDLDVPGDACTGFLLAHKNVFRHVDPYCRSWPTAAEAIAADASPLGGSRRRFITFDLDDVWTPQTHPAPPGTTWADGALDVTDLELGHFLADHQKRTEFAWEPWTVDALNQWLDHQQASACDVPALVAATAGLDVEHLEPALAARHEPASHVIAVVRALADQRVTAQQMTSVLPGLLI